MRGGDICEGHIVSPAQTPVEQRDNHRPGCWDINLVTIHQKG